MAVMISNGNQRYEPITWDTSINKRLKQIEELKEALRQVDTVDDEVRLLRHLSDEIRELRELRERRHLTI